MNEQLADIKKDFSQWYLDVVYKAELADQSPVRGCIVIRPYGYAIWELIRDRLDTRIKATGHQNASFPLLIPESFLKREAEHVEGFSPELAVVTHAGGKELEEPLVVRPTSETIIHYMFARWLTSWRDLPIKINQWANVVRWEMRTRPFLRTTEFFWQEGHTAHETAAEAEAEARMMLKEYIDLAHEYLAIPVIAGRKSEHEKFPGADLTLTYEALMQDGKALQMGTSHLISQSFARAFNMSFQDRNGQQAYPYLTSWGATTRLVGAVVMTHGDQKGLILPPKIAPIQVVIIPIYKAGTDATVINEALERIKQTLSPWRIHVDAAENLTPGAKFYHWELKGVPLRLEVGPRDIAQGQVVIADRITGKKQVVAHDDLARFVDVSLEEMQTTLLERARQRLSAQWHKVAKLADFAAQLEADNGLYQAGWCGDAACEAILKQHKATTRCLLNEKTLTVCFQCDKASIGDVLIAKAY
ncbi:proline--tRNA ligase [Candidatus Dependentiae bacterium]|nr:proline--tRNA ligase [Candidatus Dependentiae bacterium]MCC7414932.1 proline--tRNA ligase [Campylobacterota bacterium]